MKAKWKENKNLKHVVIINKINEIKKIIDGKPIFSGGDLYDAKIILENMISFPSAANDLDKYKLVNDALWEVFKTTGTAETFIKQVNTNIKIALAKRENKYHLLTSISIVIPIVRSLVLNECKIKFYKSNFPRNFKGRAKLINSESGKSETESLGYTKLVIEITAKSESIAIKKGMRILDLMRSFFCLFTNSYDEYIGDQWEPINKVRLGEFHTIHNNNGEIYSEIFWYDPSYSYSKPYYSLDIAIILKNVKNMICKLNKLNKLNKLDIKYNLIITEGLLRYVRAFDEKNQNTAVMRAWGALESIAAPNESNCDSVTKRCSFLLDDPLYHKQILEHLREYRNRNVHAGEEREKAKNIGFQIQRYFKKLVLFHVQNLGRFNSIKEANDFLDMPTNQESLLRSKKIIERALIFRGYDN